jgi:hypothetical protein
MENQGYESQFDDSFQSLDDSFYTALPNRTRSERSIYFDAYEDEIQDSRAMTPNGLSPDSSYIIHPSELDTSYTGLSLNGPFGSSQLQLITDDPSMRSSRTSMMDLSYIDFDRLPKVRFATPERIVNPVERLPDTPESNPRNTASFRFKKLGNVFKGRNTMRI